MALFLGYIAVFAVKKRIINANPWQERKDITFLDIFGTSHIDVIRENSYSNSQRIDNDGFIGSSKPRGVMA